MQKKMLCVFCMILLGMAMLSGCKDDGKTTSYSVVEDEQKVWVDDTGSKYHATSGCSNMSNPYQISISEAEAKGYKACKKCY